MEQMKVENNLVLSDPCYKKNNGYNKVLSVKKGMWNTDFVTTSDNRIASIMMIHADSDFEKVKNALYSNEEEIDALGVDSGTMCICDEKYFDEIYENKEKRDEIYKAADYKRQKNPNYVPYVETKPYERYLSEMLKKINKTMKKYNLEGDENLLEKGAISEYGLYSSTEFMLFRQSLNVTYYDENLVNDVFEKLKNDSCYSEVISSQLDLWRKKCMIYDLFVKNEIRNCIKDIGCQIMVEMDLHKRSEYDLIPQAGIVNNKCFVASSGYGDGFYPYYINKDEKEEIDGIMILFIFQ